MWRSVPEITFPVTRKAGTTAFSKYGDMSMTMHGVYSTCFSLTDDELGMAHKTDEAWKHTSSYNGVDERAAEESKGGNIKGKESASETSPLTRPHP